MTKKDKSEISDPRINLLHKEDNEHAKNKKIFKLSKFIIYLFVILLVAFVVFSYQVLFTNNSITKIFAGKVGFLQQLSSLAGNDGTLKGEADDRINILLLGMGGKGHDGPYLTDTIMIASIQPSTNKVSLISIPRDLLVEIPGYGWWKINNANAFGEQKDSTNGGDLVKKVISETFGIPVHYYVRVDFSGFEKFIDELGGLKVFVDNGFTDYQFPTDDYKYQVVSFEEGFQTMDGEAALNFARSRHGNNGEGSGFARSKRQQKILQAIKERVLSYSLMLSPRKIKGLTANLADHLKTDFEFWEVLNLAKVAKNLDTKNIYSYPIDDAVDGVLYATIVNEAYVLKPKGDNFSHISFIVKNIFNTQQIEQKESETIKIEIRNGTTINGLASRNSTELKFKGYRITKIANAPKQDYEKTIIYRLSSDDLNDKVKELETLFRTEVKNSDYPSWITDFASPETDFFIILGQDADIAIKE